MQVGGFERGFRLGGCRIEPRTNTIDGTRVDAKTMDVLLALARSAPDPVSVDELLGTVWTDVVVVDNVVHQCVAHLRKVLGDDARRPRFVETIARRGYRLLFAPEPVAWAPARAMRGATHVVLAVLAFDTLSEDPELEHLADGVAEEIRATVRRRTRLQVIGRASSRQFTGTGKVALHVGQVLGATHVLDGTVRRSGDRIRITVELVECESASSLWSARFERVVEDAFSVQDEVALACARVLSQEAMPERSGASTESSAAYDAYLRGRALVTYSSAARNAAAIAHLERAVALDPTFGRACGELALAYALHAVIAPVQDDGARWKAACERALELDPNDANALAAKAFHITLSAWDWRRAGEHYERARNSGLSPGAVLLYGTHYLAPLERWQDARDVLQEALRTDPYNMSILFDLGQWSQHIGAEEALSYAHRILELQPDNHDAWALLADAHAQLEQRDEALAALARLDVDRLEAFHRYLYVRALTRLGERQQARAVVRGFERRAERTPAARSWLTWVYVGAGRYEKAIVAFEAEYAARIPSVVFARAATRGHRGSRRRDALLARMNLDDASLRAAGLR